MRIFNACNTAHYFYNDIKEKINIDFLNMIEETAKFVQSNYPITKNRLLGTDGTLDSKIYDLYFNKKTYRL